MNKNKLIFFNYTQIENLNLEYFTILHKNTVLGSNRDFFPKLKQKPYWKTNDNEWTQKVPYRTFCLVTKPLTIEPLKRVLYRTF